MAGRHRLRAADPVPGFPAAGHFGQESGIKPMEYLINLAILFSIYGILALSLNLLVGYTGLLSLAQAAFYGIGAYAAALLITKGACGFFAALLCGMGISAMAALAIG